MEKDKEISSPRSNDTDYKPDPLLGDSYKSNPKIFDETGDLNLAEYAKKPPSFKSLDMIV